ncbi:MAG: hypothetical protein RML46_05315 [Anaerolineae bacterium]|nr:hypothetical protein [Anaerolineae bacterium]
MEVVLQQAKTLVVVDDEARLAHALRLARGFALCFVRCNIPLYRAGVVAPLKRTLARPIIEVDLTDESEVYSAVVCAAESTSEDSVPFIWSGGPFTLRRPGAGATDPAGVELAASSLSAAGTPAGFLTARARWTCWPGRPPISTTGTAACLK